MGKKVESYQSDDGKLFATEREMVMHEIDITLRKEFPALKIGLGAISQNADRLLEILQPLASCPPKNHPAEVAQTTLEPPVAVDHGELVGTCDCSAGMNGASDHAPTCPSFKGTVLRCRYAHPPGTRCPACQSVPRHLTVVPAPEAKSAHG